MSIYDTLNDNQKKAVFTTEGPVLILAGAGSGKTRALTHRIAYLIEKKQIAPWNILAITFTNKAAGEMRERVNSLVDYGADSIWVSTFHSMCVRILRRHIENLGFSAQFSIYDSDDQKILMRQVLKNLDMDPKIYKEKAVLSAISAYKDKLVTPDEAAVSASGDFRKMKTAEAYAYYQSKLKQNNALDFDDLIVKTIELLQSNREVRDYYQERFKYILVDEYQDTNYAQFKLVSILADKYRNLCVVGDDDQSIYKFRGADIENILGFERVYPDASVIKLEQNYRSTGNILNAANEVIKNNYDRKNKRLWTANEDGKLVKFIQYDSAEEEALNIVKDIQSRALDNGGDYNEFAVLYRTNAQSRLIEEKCIKLNVPYQLIGGVNFYQRKEIKDILAYLKTIDNGLDDLAVKRIINVPKRGIGATSEGRVDLYAEVMKISFYDACCRAKEIPGIGKAADKLDSFTNIIAVLRAKSAVMSVDELIDEIVNRIGYKEDMLKNDDEITVQTRIENIEELKNKAVHYCNTADNPTLSGFLEEVALVADIDSMDNSDNRIVLMTLHGAKGLEFPVVYLAGLEDGLFPSMMSINSGDNSDIEEERRLCYVGITRARRELIMTAAKLRMVNGEIHMCKVSRFIEEIPSELLDETRKRSAYSSGYGSSSYFSDYDECGYGGSGYRKNNYGSSQYSSYQKSGNGSMSDYNLGGSAYYSNYNNIFDKDKKSTKVNNNIRQCIVRGRDLATGKAEALEYTIGDRVKHFKFGEGSVLSITEQKRDYEVTVDFDKAGVKKMYAAFAKLKRID